MSDQPPSFTPDPHRRRPDSRDAAAARATRRSVMPPRPEADAGMDASPPPPIIPPRADRRPRSDAPASMPPVIPPTSQRRTPPPPETTPRVHRDTRPEFRPVAPPASRPTAPNGCRKRHPIRWILALLVALLALVAAWAAFLIHDANANIGRVAALSGSADTPGTTYLLAGSDSRADGAVKDETEGQRSDSLMLVNVAPNGQASAISLPRDTWVTIPGYGEDKLNASFALGGAPLLVTTVEQLTGLTVDHYVEIGMGGVASIVDAVGGVELCYDSDVSDPLSGMEWTAGCHVSDGAQALAFSRMRYSDPLGDIGRAARQRQVVQKTVTTALAPTTLINPAATLRMERAGVNALTIDDDSSVTDVAHLLLAFRKAGNDGLTGAPPIESLGYETASGSAVLLVDTTAPDFFAKVRSGTLDATDFVQRF